MSAKTRYITQCARHGVESKDWAGKQVVVQQPSTKAERRDGGCPFCRAEAIAAAKEHANTPNTL